MALEPLTPDRRRAMTRRHLLEAAAVVFARDGFHGASLDDVAATAGFTKGAVYSNFKNKDDLFVALLEDRMDQQAAAVSHELYIHAEMGVDEQMERMRTLIEPTWNDEWTALYLEFVLYARRNPQARAKLTASTKRQHAIVVRMYEDQYARIEAATPYPSSVMATFSLALFDGLSLARLASPEEVTAETVMEALAFLYATFGVDGPPDAPHSPTPAT